MLRFISNTSIDIKRLSGFKKGLHKLPDVFSASADLFIKGLASTEIREHIARVSDKVREALNLKRKEFEITHQEGVSEFRSPCFLYTYSAGLLKDNIGRAAFIAELVPTDPKNLLKVGSGLDPCFPHWFDLLHFGLNDPIDLTDLIDKLESANYKLKYPSDCSEITLTDNKLRREITITKDEIKIWFRAQETISGMIEGLLELSDQMNLISPRYKLLP